MCALDNRLRFTDEQAMLQDAAVAFCRDRSTIRQVRDRIDTPEGFDRSVWEEMVGLGWSGIAIPESFGGSGLGLAEIATLAEPIGRHLLATPFESTQLFVQGLLASGDAPMQTRCLGRIAQGRIGTVALFEEEGHWDLLQPQASATRDGDSVALQGRKTFVIDAGVADHLLVSVSLNGTPALALLDAADLAARPPERETVIDETRRSYSVSLDGIRLPAASLITGASAKAALRAIRDTGWLLNSALAAGGIAGVLDVVVDYLNTRTTFGRKIGSYQSLKHTCADILVGLERSRSHVYHAATRLADGEDAEIALRMAKAESGDTFVFAGDRAVQFHGGFGFTYDCDAQLFLRRAIWLQSGFGDAAHHRRHLADLLLSPTA